MQYKINHKVMLNRCYNIGIKQPIIIIWNQVKELFQHLFYSIMTMFKVILYIVLFPIAMFKSFIIEYCTVFLWRRKNKNIDTLLKYKILKELEENENEKE